MLVLKNVIRVRYDNSDTSKKMFNIEIGVITLNRVKDQKTEINVKRFDL